MPESAILANLPNSTFAPTPIFRLSIMPGSAVILVKTRNPGKTGIRLRYPGKERAADS